MLENLEFNKKQINIFVLIVEKNMPKMVLELIFGENIQKKDKNLILIKE